MYECPGCGDTTDGSACSCTRREELHGPTTRTPQRSRRKAPKLPSEITCARDGAVYRKPHPRVRPLGKRTYLGRVEKMVNGWHAWPPKDAPQKGPFGSRREAVEALL